MNALSKSITYKIFKGCIFPQTKYHKAMMGDDCLNYNCDYYIWLWVLASFATLDGKRWKSDTNVDMMNIATPIPLILYRWKRWRVFILENSNYTFSIIVCVCVCVCVLVAQLCLTLCDTMDCSPPGSSIHETHQARKLSVLPFPSPGNLLIQESNPMRSPSLQTDFLPSEPPGKLFLSLTAIEWKC